jgi:peroxiredoxin Q/BCP
MAVCQRQFRGALAAPGLFAFPTSVDWQSCPARAIVRRRNILVLMQPVADSDSFRHFASIDPKRRQKEGPTMLHEGDKAPDFTLPDSDGKIRKLSDRKGHYTVVYFYPKDDTSGCTKEAQTFTELMTEFANLKAEVIGISPDSAKSHAKFRDKYELQVTLLSDEQKSAVEAYGVWVEKKMYGKAYMGVERSTFLVGPDGAIVQAWKGVKVPGHAAAVLEALKRQK